MGSRRGVSLVEVMVVLAILGLLCALTVPGLLQLREQAQMRGALQSLYSDLQEARTLALTQRRTVRLAWQANAGGSCYIVHSGASGSCRCDAAGAVVCSVPASLHKHVWLARDSRLRVEGSVEQIAFHPRYGTVSRSGTLSLVHQRGSRAAQVVAITGRVRTCGSADLGLDLSPCRA